MSAASSNVENKTVGIIKVRRVTPRTEKDNYYRCTWDLKGDFKDNMKEELKSPKFTVPNRDECKWYLSVHSLYDGMDKGMICFSMRLYLDSKSECKAAVAKFRFQIYNHGSGNNSCKSRTFKFTKNSENSADILTMISSRELQSHWSDSEDKDEEEADELYDLTVHCMISVINVIPEDNSFSTDFGSLLKNNLSTDVVLSAGEKKFPAHKLILSARSSVFAAMFAHNTTENQGLVNIKDIREEVVEEMIHYIYTGEAEKLNDFAQDLLIAADKYDLKGLRRECEGVLIESLSSSNVFDLVLFAESYNANKLKFEAIYLIRRKKELMETSAWECLNKSSPALVREISEAHLHPEPSSDSDPDTDDSYRSMTPSGSEFESE